MEPGKTSFFQALGVPTKIARGTIEITTDLKLVEAGTKVGASEATLLNMLNVSSFLNYLNVCALLIILTDFVRNPLAFKVVTGY